MCHQRTFKQACSDTASYFFSFIGHSFPMGIFHFVPNFRQREVQRFMVFVFINFFDFMQTNFDRARKRALHLKNKLHFSFREGLAPCFMNGKRSATKSYSRWSDHLSHYGKSWRHILWRLL